MITTKGVRGGGDSQKAKLEKPQSHILRFVRLPEKFHPWKHSFCFTKLKPHHFKPHVTPKTTQPPKKLCLSFRVQAQIQTAPWSASSGPCPGAAPTSRSPSLWVSPRSASAFLTFLYCTSARFLCFPSNLCIYATKNGFNCFFLPPEEFAFPKKMVTNHFFHAQFCLVGPLKVRHLPNIPS